MSLLPRTATMSNKFIVKFRPFNKVECCFDIVTVFGHNVAVFGKNVERVFREILSFWLLSTKSKQSEHGHCSISFDFVKRMKCSLKLLPKTATMLKQHLTLSKESFDL